MAKQDLEKAGWKVNPPSKEKGQQVWFGKGKAAAPASKPDDTDE